VLWAEFAELRYEWQWWPYVNSVQQLHCIQVLHNLTACFELYWTRSTI